MAEMVEGTWKVEHLVGEVVEVEMCWSVEDARAVKGAMGSGARG